jgi:hypothetical protein
MTISKPSSICIVISLMVANILDIVIICAQQPNLSVNGRHPMFPFLDQSLIELGNHLIDHHPTGCDMMLKKERKKLWPGGDNTIS